MGSESVKRRPVAMSFTGPLRDNPTQEQKAVYRFYESRHSNDADNIYSIEWFSRVVKFQESSNLRKEKGDRLPWKEVDDLSFGPLFVLHPVPAFSLWLLLEACNDLDRKVCSDVSENVLQSWRSLEPVPYLKSDEVLSQWRKSLEVLNAKRQRDELGGEILLQELYDMVSGIRRMERALSALRDGIRAAKRDKVFLADLLEVVSNAVDARCEIITAAMEDRQSLGDGTNKSGFPPHVNSSHSSLDAVSQTSSESIVYHDISQESTNQPQPPWTPQDAGLGFFLVLVVWSVIWNVSG